MAMEEEAHEGCQGSRDAPVLWMAQRYEERYERAEARANEAHVLIPL